VTLCRDLSDENAGLKRVLTAEAQRRSKGEQYGWSIFEPYYDAAHFQRQMRIFASLARAFARLYGRQTIESRDEWVQGAGELHRLVLPLDFGGVALRLEFAEPGKLSTRTAKAMSVSSTTLRIVSDDRIEDACEWTDTPDARLEDQLDGIAQTILECAERILRRWAQRHYERRIERREEMRLEAARRRVEAEKKRLEDLASHRAKVRDEVLELAQQYRVANDIRTLLALMSEHPDVRSDASELFANWKAEATRVADLLDPLKRPFIECVPTYAKALQSQH
jgi:hypothetical protein